MTSNKRLRYEAEKEYKLIDYTYDYDINEFILEPVYHYGLYEDLEELEKETE